MKTARLVAMLLLSACNNAPQPDRGRGYVQASFTASGDVMLEVTAPESHPLFLANCNGQMNWFLVDRGPPRTTADATQVLWGYGTDACMSQPIRVDPGQARRFILPRPGATNMPLAGAYRVLLPNVHSAWPPADTRGTAAPAPDTQIAPNLLTSGVIVLH